MPVQYADYAIWQREYAESEQFKVELDYWRERLSAAPPVLKLPMDHPRPVRRAWRGGRARVVLSAELSTALKQLSTKQGATLFMTLLAAFKILLHRYTDHENIVVGTPIAGRNRAELEPLIGFFINTLVLNTDLSGHPSFVQLLDRVRAVCLGAYSHQEMPFERLVEEFQPQRNARHTPLVQVLFNMQNFAGHAVKFAGLEASGFLSGGEAGAKFDLTLYAYESPSGIQFEIVYNSDLFERSRIVAFGEQLEYLLAQIAANPEREIDSFFSLVTPAAQAVLPDPTLPLNLPAQKSAIEIFAEQVERAPEQLAVVDEQRSWTYKELAAYSNARSSASARKQHQAAGSGRDLRRAQCVVGQRDSRRTQKRRSISYHRSCLPGVAIS